MLRAVGFLDNLGVLGASQVLRHAIHGVRRFSIFFIGIRIRSDTHTVLVDLQNVLLGGAKNRLHLAGFSTGKLLFDPISRDWEVRELLHISRVVHVPRIHRRIRLEGHMTRHQLVLLARLRQFFVNQGFDFDLL